MILVDFITQTALDRTNLHKEALARSDGAIAFGGCKLLTGMYSNGIPASSHITVPLNKTFVESYDEKISKRQTCCIDRIVR